MFVEKLLGKKPDLLALCDTEPGFFPALLESQSLSEKTGRYDILFAAPSSEYVAYDQQQLDELLKVVDTAPGQLTTTQQAFDSPFQFGWLVYFSYESAYLLEPKLTHLMSQSSEPLAAAIYCQGAVIYDHMTGQATLWAESGKVANTIEKFLKKGRTFKEKSAELKQIEQADGSEFEQAVIVAKELIQAGDIYQANLSRQYKCNTNTHLSASHIMSRLRAANPAPFAGLLQLNDFAVVSSSPERLFKVSGGVIETRPIAGTRPRGASETVDLALIDELIKTPKERAEHIMLIDLGRNDMGRVCQVGTVQVDELMAVESYQHVHHIVSNITGQLKLDVTFVDVLKALFPGGTITGCPKIRCMEVIQDIERHNRGCYTGSMGYINHDGQVDLNILIRTVAMKDEEITFNAGAGIVYDSDPKAELQETRYKAKGLLNALGLNVLDDEQTTQ